MNKKKNIKYVILILGFIALILAGVLITQGNNNPKNISKWFQENVVLTKVNGFLAVDSNNNSLNGNTLKIQLHYFIDEDSNYEMEKELTNVSLVEGKGNVNDITIDKAGKFFFLKNYKTGAINISIDKVEPGEYKKLKFTFKDNTSMIVNFGNIKIDKLPVEHSYTEDFMKKTSLGFMVRGLTDFNESRGNGNFFFAVKTTEDIQVENMYVNEEFSTDFKPFKPEKNNEELKDYYFNIKPKNDFVGVLTFRPFITIAEGNEKYNISLEQGFAYYQYTDEMVEEIKEFNLKSKQYD